MPGWLDRWAEKRMEKGRRIIAEAEAAGHPTEMPDLGSLVSHAREELRDAFDDMFDDRSGVITPPAGADFRRPPPLTADPAVATAERAARDAARAPYRAAAAPVFTRFATTGEHQLPQLVAALAQLRPEAVFGVYRVPDRFDERRSHEDRAYLEWEIVHLPDAAGATPVHLAGFARADTWARRAPGEPRVLDEDMAGALVARARLAPEDCFGLTRLWQVRVDGELHHRARVDGTLVVSRRDLSADQHALAVDAPLDADPPPFHVTILDWEAVAAWVAPKRWYPPRSPSPLPHLPDRPQELLTMYLEVVGVRPEDCYAAQVTRTTDAGLGDLGPAGVSRAFDLPQTPCADGTDRARLDAAEHVVVAYRDTPDYAEGRRRWAAYEDEVLHARLSHLTDVRPPLEVSENADDPFLLEVANMFNPLDPMHDFPRIFNRNERPAIGPYCGRLP